MMKVYESAFIDYVGLNIYQPHFWTNLNLWNLGSIHILQPREGKSSAVASNEPEWNCKMQQGTPLDRLLFDS